MAEPAPSASPHPSALRPPVPTVRPLPASQPPYDDEAGRTVVSDPTRPQAGQGVLAMNIVPVGVARPVLRPRLRLVDPADVSRSRVDPPPEPRRWAARFVQAVMETIHGHRPLRQLRQWTDEAVHRHLAFLAAQARHRPKAHPRLRTLRLCRVGAAAIEVSAVLQAGSQVMAAALRIELAGQRWRCTAFDLIAPGSRVTPAGRPDDPSGCADRRGSA